MPVHGVYGGGTYFCKWIIMYSASHHVCGVCKQHGGVTHPGWPRDRFSHVCCESNGTLYVGDLLCVVFEFLISLPIFPPSRRSSAPNLRGQRRSRRGESVKFPRASSEQNNTLWPLTSGSEKDSESGFCSWAQLSFPLIPRLRITHQISFSLSLVSLSISLSKDHPSIIHHAFSPISSEPP